MERCKNSQDFVDAKKLIYVEKYRIDSVKIQFNRTDDGKQTEKAEIIFCKEDMKRTIISEEHDFIWIAFHLKSVIRNGKNKIVEIRDTNSFYDNVKYFEIEPESGIKEAIRELNEGKIKLNFSASPEKAIDDIANQDFTNPDIKELVEKYKYVLALSIIKLQFIWTNFEKTRAKAFSPKKFYDLLNISGKVYQDHLLQLSPLETVKEHSRISRIDIEHISKILLQHNQTSFEKWKALTADGTKPVDGKNAATELIKDYQGHYEIAKKILRHLAGIVGNSKGITVETESDIEKILKDNGYGALMETIDRRLRNCGTHLDVDYSEKGKVKLVDSRGRKTRIVGEITYEEIVDNLHGIRDLTAALFFSMVSMEELVYLRALDSPDLKFLIVENFKPN